MRSLVPLPLLFLPLLSSAVLAHFDLTFPASRGENSGTQSTAPCGGLDTPSAVRTGWGITGGSLKFEAGHEEAHTEVRLGLGNDPTTFDVVLVPVFNQVGYGTFCWQKVDVNNVSGVKEGTNATIQVMQAGHSGGWLYNCADITFTANPTATVGECKNGTGVYGESIGGTQTPTSGGNGTTPTPSSTQNAAAISGNTFGALGFAAGLVGLLAGLV